MSDNQNRKHPSPARKLAAILFADIAGYTALMQKDEATARQMLDKFHFTINTKVESHQGRVVNNYGDGCVCTFDSAVSAMLCAKELQQDFQSLPKVPVRIGLHSGDVFFEKDNVYGDSVNIASRIESLGVPGAVLFSKRIKRHISNQKELKVELIGEFDFKNVEKSMEVFALANEGFIVPKREDLKGKVKQQEKATYPKWLIPLSTILLIAIGIFFWKNNNEKNNLPQEILNSRIAVLPYENYTNDTTLNVLGNMAADWVTRNLLNLENVKIVQFDNVKDNLKFLKASANQFANQTGAEKIIKGKFYQEGGELIFESQITNPQTGEVIYALPIVQGNKAKPSELISQLSQRIAGYFALQESTMKYVSAPKYEAFVELEKGNEFFGRDYDRARKHLNNAIKLDSSFFMPYNMLAFSYLNQGRYQESDSVFHRMKKLKTQSKLEIFLLALHQAVLEGNLNQQFQLAKEIFNDDPKHLMKNYSLGLQGLRVNKPATTIATCQQFDPSTFDFKSPSQVWWYSNYADAYIRLGKYEQALKILRAVPSEVEPFYDPRQQIYTLMNQPDSLNLLIKEMEDNGVSESRILNRMYKIAYDYGVAKDTANQMLWGKKLLARIQNRPESIPLNKDMLLRAFFITDDHGKTIETYEDIKRSTGNAQNFLVHLGITYAKMGNQQKALEVVQKMEEQKHQYSFGRFTYNQALIYACMNDKETAMRILQQAFREGYDFNSFWRYGYSYSLVSMHDYPPFEEFVKPKG